MALVWKEITDPGLQWDMIQTGLVYQHPVTWASRYATRQQGFAWSREEWLAFYSRGMSWSAWVLLEE